MASLMESSMAILNGWFQEGKIGDAVLIDLQVNNDTPVVGETVIVNWEIKGDIDSYLSLLIDDRVVENRVESIARYTFEVNTCDEVKVSIQGDTVSKTIRLTPQVIKPKLHCELSSSKVFTDEQSSLFIHSENTQTVSLSIETLDDPIVLELPINGEFQLPELPIGKHHLLIKANSMHGQLSTEARTSKSLILDVREHEPIFNMLDLTESVDVNQTSELSWHTEYAESVLLYVGSKLQTELPAIGEQRISFARIGLKEIKLIAKSPSGKTITKEQSIDVTSPKPLIKFNSSETTISSDGLIEFDIRLEGVKSAYIQTRTKRKIFIEPNNQKLHLHSVFSDTFTLVAQDYKGVKYIKNCAIKVKKPISLIKNMTKV